MLETGLATCPLMPSSGTCMLLRIEVIKYTFIVEVYINALIGF